MYKIILALPVFAALISICHTPDRFVCTGAQNPYEESAYGDCQRICIYSMNNNDSVSFSSRSALFYPMNSVVIIDGCQFVVEANSSANDSTDSASAFDFKVGEYYTNLE